MASEQDKKPCDAWHLWTSKPQVAMHNKTKSPKSPPSDFVAPLAFAASMGTAIKASCKTWFGRGSARGIETMRYWRCHGMDDKPPKLL